MELPNQSDPFFANILQYDNAGERIQSYLCHELRRTREVKSVGSHRH
jgi:hypothetical protein